MAKKPPPDPLTPNFSNSAKPTKEQILERRLTVLSPKSQREYRKVCEDQQRAMKHFKEEIADTRDLKIENLARRIMDRKIAENHLALRPPSARNNRPQEKLARQEATISVDMEAQRKLSVVDAKYYEERYRTVQRLHLQEQCLKDFNATNPAPASRSIGRDDGNER